MESAYIPVTRGYYEIPLNRYLPTVPRGVFENWLVNNTKTGTWVADPMGANPVVAIEAAQASRRILFARNNPILWLLTETLAAAPTSAYIRSLISKLLLVRFSGETLESHLRSLYETECASCGKSLQPDLFVWERDTAQPISKVYTCPVCGDTGEKPVNEKDLIGLKRIGDYRLHSIRALKRVTSENEGLAHERLSKALECYLPRGLYVCMMLVNAMGSLPLEKKELKILQTALLSIFDDANTLWPWPSRDFRPTQLNRPERYMEKNLWLSLDQLDRTWSFTGKKVDVTYWPKLPISDSGICLYQRRLVEKKGVFKLTHPDAVITSFPKPNLAFWTLSALWSGWLWGEKAALPMRNAMQRSKYDWLWYTNAIFSAFKPFKPQSDDIQSIFGLISYNTSNLFYGASLGMNFCDFSNFSCASRKEDGLIQCEWRSGAFEKNNRYQISDLLHSFFNAYCQPAELSEIILYCLANLNHADTLPESINDLDIVQFGKIQDEIIKALKDDNVFQQYKSEQSGATQWFPIDGNLQALSFFERIEKHILELLCDKKDFDPTGLEQRICDEFRGFLAPPSEYIKLLLETYLNDLPDDLINLEPDKNSGPGIQKKVGQEIQQLLQQCAKMLGFLCTVEDERLLWKNQAGKIEKVFWIVTNFTNLVCILNKANQTESNNLVFPGNHSRLLLYRIKNDLRIDQMLSTQWHLLKFRTVQKLSQQTGLNLGLWDEIVLSDPPQWDTPFQALLI